MAEGSKPENRARLVIDPNPVKKFTIIDGNGKVIGEGASAAEAVLKSKQVTNNTNETPSTD